MSITTTNNTTATNIRAIEYRAIADLLQNNDAIYACYNGGPRDTEMRALLYTAVDMHNNPGNYRKGC